MADRPMISYAVLKRGERLTRVVISPELRDKIEGGYLSLVLYGHAWVLKPERGDVAFVPFRPRLP